MSSSNLRQQISKPAKSDPTVFVLLVHLKKGGLEMARAVYMVRMGVVCSNLQSNGGHFLPERKKTKNYYKCISTELGISRLWHSLVAQLGSIIPVEKIINKLKLYFF